MYNFCTLFDKNYLYKGVALCNSIFRHCGSFRLWILCMDEETFEILKKMKLKNVELVHLTEIEDAELLAVKKTRNPGEYAWTCKSYLLLFILKNNKKLEVITYLDSDLYFFESPQRIYKELKDNSVMLTPHRFGKEKMHWEKTRGRYNAGVIIFKNDDVAMKCLKEWKSDCLAWCFERYEEGKLGDQLYLNHWNEKFSGVHDIENVGANLGPWSLSKYEIMLNNNEILVDGFPLSLFHFHALKIFSLFSFEPAFGYNVSKKNITLLYEPYYAELKRIILNVNDIDENFNFGFSDRISFYRRVKDFISKILQ